MSTRKEKPNTKFIGERLRVVRTAKSLTLADVAGEIRKTRQYVSQLETGMLFPTDEMWYTLAEVLGVKRDFFINPLRHSIDASEVHFRHRLTTPDSKKREVLSKLQVLQELVDGLENIFDLPEVSFPEIQCSSNEDIERAAEKTRLHMGVSLETPIGNLTRLIEYHGGIVTTLAGHDVRLDALSLKRTRPIFVILDKDISQSPARIRFDLGHELGHIVMHPGIETGGKELEGQANRFASSLLMPRSSFLREFSGEFKRFDWSKIYSFKIRWGVSVAAIVRRLFDLKLINSDQYRRGQIYLSKTGQRQRERFDDKLAIEVPEVLEKCWSALSSQPQKKIDLQKQTNLNSSFIESVFKLNAGNNFAANE